MLAPESLGRGGQAVRREHGRTTTEDDDRDTEDDDRDTEDDDRDTAFYEQRRWVS